jgi:hypothetical protein
MLTLNIARRRHILGFEAEGRRSPDKAGMVARIHHRREIFCGQRKSRAANPAPFLRLVVPGFDVRFDFHALSFSLWMLTLNIERRRHLLSFEAGNAANLYNRKRDGESITLRKYFCAQKSRA